jgi:hypothetical protein
MTIKCTHIFNSKALQNLPKLGFLVSKYLYHLATLLPTTQNDRGSRRWFCTANRRRLPDVRSNPLRGSAAAAPASPPKLPDTPQRRSVHTKRDRLSGRSSHLRKKVHTFFFSSFFGFYILRQMNK